MVSTLPCWFSCDKKGNYSLKEDLWCPVLNLMKIINVTKLFYVTLTVFQKGNKTFCLDILCYYFQTPINGALFRMLLLKKGIACYASMHMEIKSHDNGWSFTNWGEYTFLASVTKSPQNQIAVSMVTGHFLWSNSSHPVSWKPPTAQMPTLWQCMLFWGNEGSDRLKSKSCCAPDKTFSYSLERFTISSAKEKEGNIGSVV